MYRKFLAAIAATTLSFSAFAQLEPWKDYTVGDQVMEVTTVKVDPNMTEFYLEGIKQTWVAASEVNKELGHIEDYLIYASDLPQSGDFNLVLVTVYKDLESMAPSKERYEAFMEAWGEAHMDETREISRDYPSMREITGQYLLRPLQMKMDGKSED